MDIEEIVCDGIDVWRRVNIEDIESLSGEIGVMRGMEV